MKLKQLQSILEDVEVFKEPKISLEQYATQPHIAATILYTIQTTFQDVKDKVIVDLGCGCGMLSIGASLLGAAHCIGLDIDGDALNILQANCDDLDITNVEAIQLDVCSGSNFFHRKVDTVIMNPPFGTKRNSGIDMMFVKQALTISNRVYSLHKTSTRKYILQKAKDWSLNTNVLAQVRFDLPHTYRFHKRNSKDIEVDFILFEKM